MLRIEIPGYGDSGLEFLVMDFNGTLACDGALIEGVRAALETLSKQLQLHVVTADTFGRAREALCDVPCRLVVLPAGNQAEAKRDYVEALGASASAAIGNGRNDSLMLKAAALGIALMQQEGAAKEAILAADVVSPDILSGLGLLAHPLRLKATLRR